MNKIMPICWLMLEFFLNGAILKYEQDYYADMMAVVNRKYMKVSFTTLRPKYCLTPDEAQAGQLSIHAKVEKKCFGLFKLEASTFLQSGASSNATTM